MLIKCTECSKEISDKATSCPHCGCPLSEMDSSSSDVNNVSTANKIHFKLCPHCGCQLLQSTTKCPRCLAILDSPANIQELPQNNEQVKRKENSGRYVALVVVMTIIIFVVGYFFVTSANNSKSSDVDNIVSRTLSSQNAKEVINADTCVVICDELVALERSLFNSCLEQLYSGFDVGWKEIILQWDEDLMETISFYELNESNSENKGMLLNINNAIEVLEEIKKDCTKMVSDYKEKTRKFEELNIETDRLRKLFMDYIKKADIGFKPVSSFYEVNGKQNNHNASSTSKPLTTTSNGHDWCNATSTQKTDWCDLSFASWEIMGYDTSKGNVDVMKSFFDNFYAAEDGKSKDLDIVTLSEQYAALSNIY